VDRPGQGNRPDFRPDNRPNFRPDNRPNFRPGDRDGLRPDINVNNFNRTNNVIGSGNRAAIGSGNRSAWGSVNRNAWSYGNRRGWTNRPYYNHGNWYRGGWSGWYRNPAWWVAGAATAGWMLSPSYVYSNPFYVAPTTVVDPGLDYSQPIVVPQPVVQQTVVIPDQQPDLASAEAAEAAEAPPTEEQAMPEAADREFTAARDSFKSGNFPQALRQVDQAITALPSDPVLHEFRGLVLFAMKRYPEAAATIYAVLSSGPGWNWDTMKSLYPNEQTYTNQLRALEEFQRQNPKSADGHFLLAYHYLVLNYPEQAEKQLEQVVNLLPNDKLAPEILKALKPPAEQRPGPGGG
jgi:tetratricopeptide (TPR) repeat protein